MPDSLPPNPRDLISQIANFSEFKTPTRIESRENIPYFLNEFWTSGQRRAHPLHEISYRGCFKPQLPRFFIDRATKQGDIIHDPFMGRGTTPIEAALTGRIAYGNDINPLSKILARPRLATPPAHEAIAKTLKEINWQKSDSAPQELLAFYHPDTLQALCALREFLIQRAPIENPTPDPILDWIRMIAVNRLTGHSPGFFSVRTMPPNQAVSVATQEKLNQRHNTTPPPRDVAALILKKSKNLLRTHPPIFAHPPQLFTGSAAETPHIPNASISLVVTSPPFLDVVQYADDNWLRAWFCGIDIAGLPIAMHRGLDTWQKMVREVLTEQARILKPNGIVAFEVGEVRRGKIELEKCVWQAAAGLPFDRRGVMVNVQKFSKTAQCWGVTNNSSGTNTNRIVLLQRN